ncbi:MAG: hypothetical protein ACXVEF_40370 [Polyangiales bacterium]
MSNYSLYLNKSVYTAGDSTTSAGMLLITDDTTLLQTDIDGSTSFNVASTLFQNQTGGPAGGSDNLSTWDGSITAPNPPYQDQGLKVFVLGTGFPTWDPNGTLSGASADAWLQNAAPAVLKIRGTPTASTTSVVRLGKSGDFHMNDVVAGGTNPFWLSNDTRVFQIHAGLNTANGQNATHPFNVQIGAGGWNANTAHAFVTSVLAYMNNPANATEANNIFEALTADENASQLTQTQNDGGGNGLYNFAIARIHAVNNGLADTDAYVAFRLFSSLNANLAYDGHAGPNYPSVAPTVPTAVNRVATIGPIGSSAPFSIPCFGDLRTNSGDAAQTDVGNNFHFAKDPGGNTLTRTFYALVHVDINDPTPRFGTGKSVGDLLNQQHVCTVAQIITKDLPTVAGATPQNSGDLAQRNTSIAYINNPGLTPSVRAIQQNFEFVPHAGKEAKRPNELLFLTRGVPEGTKVEVFIPGLGAKKLSKETHTHVEAVDDDRVRFGIRQAVKLPIPVDPGGRYPGLVTVQFPSATDIGKEYVIDVLQLDPNTGTVVGAFRLKSAVVKARKTIADEYATADLAAKKAAEAKAGSAWAKVLGAQASFAQTKARATALEVVHELGDVARRHVAVILDQIEVPIARKEPMVLEAAVYEGGKLVATHPVRIGAGEPGIVRVGEAIYEGELVDHLAVKLTHATPRGPILRNARSWKAEVGKPLAHVGVRAATEVPSPEGWRVWYHVVEKG